MPNMQAETTKVGPRTASETMRQMHGSEKTFAEIEKRLGTEGSKAVIASMVKGERHSQTEEVFSVQGGLLVVTAQYATRTYRPHSTVEIGGEVGEEPAQATEPHEPVR